MLRCTSTYLQRLPAQLLNAVNVAAITFSQPHDAMVLAKTIMTNSCYWMASPIHALMIDLFGAPRSYPWPRIALILLRSGNWEAVTLIRFGQYFHQQGWRRMVHWSARRLRSEFGCFVQPTAQIGPGLKLPHPNGIVIGSGVRIGAECIIYQQVTLGGARRGDYGANAYPEIGDRVTLFAGAKVLGAITLGDDAQVGANAVVLRDVPPAHSAAGVPAQCRPLSRSIRERELATSRACEV